MVVVVDGDGREIPGQGPGPGQSRCTNDIKSGGTVNASDNQLIYMDDGEEEEAMDDVEEDGYENPMLNHLVVGNILRWLPVHHLLKTRLVSKLWAHEASKILRQTATVSLVSQPDDNQMLRFLATMTTCSCPSAATEVSGRCTAIPYSQFQVRYDDKLPTEPALLHREQDFFRLLGTNLTHLTLDFLEEVDANLSATLLRDLFLCNVPNLVFLSIDLPAITTADHALLPLTAEPDANVAGNSKTRRTFTYLFPKLQTLLIVDFVEDQNRPDLRVEERDRYSPGFLKDLLTTAPRLSKFSFLTRSPMLMSRVVTSLSCLALGNLSQLHLDGVINDRDISTLASHPLPLQSLRLRCLHADVRKGTLENLLFAQRRSLSELCIGDRCDYEDDLADDPRRIVLHLPLMEKLTVLTLLRRCLLTAGRFGKIRFVVCPYTKFQLPTLRKLAFDSDYPEAFEHLEDFFPRMDAPCETVKELSFSCVIAWSSVHLIRFIAQFFPAVEKVRMSKVTAEFASVVAEHMVSIVELFIYFPDFTEPGGKPSLMSLCIQLQVRNCRIIQVLRNPRNFLMYTIVITGPRIGNLTRLKRVVIETRSLRSRVQDAEVLATFTHLRILHFNRKIAVKYRDALIRRLPFVRLEESTFSDAYMKGERD